jgi:hypothetical protein
MRRIASVLATDRDAYLGAVEQRLARSRRIGSLHELETWTATLAETRVETLDLIAHSATTDRLLVLGTDVIDARRPVVRDAFERMATPLGRHGIRAVRLLGCGTATSAAGRQTLRALANLLGPIQVYGTRDMVPPWAFDAEGLCEDDEDLLVAARGVSA